MSTVAQFINIFRRKRLLVFEQAWRSYERIQKAFYPLSSESFRLSSDVFTMRSFIWKCVLRYPMVYCVHLCTSVRRDWTRTPSFSNYTYNPKRVQLIGFELEFRIPFTWWGVDLTTHFRLRAVEGRKAGVTTGWEVMISVNTKSRFLAVMLCSSTNTLFLFEITLWSKLIRVSPLRSRSA